MQEETTTEVLAPVIPDRIVFLIDDQEVNKEVLIKQKDEYVKLTIAGIEDRQGYEEVRKAVAALRTTRTTIEKKRKEMSEPFNEFVKTLKANADELGAICKEGEETLKARMDEIDTEKERIKAEKKAEAQRVLQERIAKLFELGAQFNGSIYTFSYAAGLVTNPVSLKEMSEDEWDDFAVAIHDAYDVEQERLAEEQRQREAQEAEEAERKRQEEDDLRALAEQNRKEQEAILEKRTKLREKELKLMGVTPQNGQWFHPDLSEVLCNQAAIEQMPDNVWEALIKEMEEAIEAASLPAAVAPEAPVAEEPEHDVLDELEAAKITLPQDADVLMEADRYTEVTLKFAAGCPFLDTPITPTYIQRIFPAEFGDEARQGIKVDGEGQIQGDLFYILFKK